MNDLVLAQGQNFRQLIDRQIPELKKALPRGIDANQYARVLLTSISRNPTLQKCTGLSVLGSMMEAASLGLSFDARGYAYLVPHRNTKNGTYEATLIVGYRGLIAMARQSGQVSSIYSQIVYDKEKYNYSTGAEVVLEHTPAPPSKRGKPVAVYAVAHMIDGTKEVEWMWIEEVEAIKKRSRASSNGPWVTDYEEMAKKCPLRRMSKRLPLSNDFALVAAKDEAIELGLDLEEEPPTELTASVKVEEEAEEEKQKTRRERKPRKPKTEENKPKPEKSEAPPAPTDEDDPFGE